MLRKLFRRNAAGKGKTPEERGYLRPLTVEEILSTEIRQKMLKQMRENSLLTKEATEKYYIQPLRHCVSLMQGLPGTEKEHHAVVGGLVDLTLKTVVCALRLSRGYMLPQGASAEEQSAQAVTWNAVIFYAALCHSLPVFGHLEGELADGSLWYPGLTVPSQPYRLRFCPDREEKAQAIATLLGMRLLPDEVVVWLGRTPAALDTLLSQIQGDNRPGSVVSQIISEAVGYAGGVPRTQSLQPVPQTPPAHATPVVPAAGGALVANPVIAGAADTAVTLDSALSEPPAAVVTATPPVTPVGVEPDPGVSDVMALMGFSTSQEPEAAAAAVNMMESDGVTETCGEPQTDDLVVAEEPVLSLTEHAVQSEGTADDENYGRQFLSWLLEQIDTGALTINNRDSSLHVVNGLLFVPTPGIFKDFLRENKMQPRLRKKIQDDFESQGIHFAVKGKGVYSFQKYPEEGRTGEAEDLFGYLIRLREIVPSFPVREDSRYVFISNRFNM
ncbi:DNA-binding domain-containing protein [Salmonella enterica]|nr:DNA-binding domain-containing protein [Salmonella enterica]EHG9845389.1 DNA-binding domain-containing protein [Salmonella enterica]